MGGALIGLFFFATLYLQQVLDYGPLKAGVSFLPLALTIGATAGVASQLSTKLGPKPVLISGLLVQAAGLYWFSHVSASGSFLGDVLFPSLVVAVGMGLAFVPLTIAALSGIEESESGLASGLMATAQQVGQAVGLAILAGVATTAAPSPQALTARLPGRVPRRRRLRADRRAGRDRDHPSDERDRAHRRAGPAAQLQRQADEAELLAPRPPRAPRGRATR